MGSMKPEGGGASVHVESALWEAVNIVNTPYTPIEVTLDHAR